MSQPYSQSRALWAITKASYKAIFSNPSAIIFSILFPIIFILIFGAFGNSGPIRHRIALAPDCDTNNIIFDSLKSNAFVRIIRYDDTASLRKDYEKGNLAGIIDIQPITDTSAQTKYRIGIQSTSASGNSFGLFMQTLQNLLLKLEIRMAGPVTNHFFVAPEIKEVKKYKQIDFILPGQLGFSILFSTLFNPNPQQLPFLFRHTCLIPLWHSLRLNCSYKNPVKMQFNLFRSIEHYSIWCCSVHFINRMSGMTTVASLMKNRLYRKKGNRRHILR